MDREATSLSTTGFAAGPSQGETRPLGGQRPAQRWSMGAKFPAGPPQGKLAPLGGSEPHAVGSVGALIFDMDGTMIDSMGHHAQSWIEFTRRHGIVIDVADLLRRTTGRTGAECMVELFGRPVPRDEALMLIAEKETIYRELFAPVFREVPGFTAFASQALRAGLKVGVGTAGDRHNIAFALTHLNLPFTPHAIVGGDEGFPGKPEPAIFLEAGRRMGIDPGACIVFEDAPFGIEAARRAGMRAVALCTSHGLPELAGSHVLRAVPDFNALLTTGFLEKLNVVAS